VRKGKGPPACASKLRKIQPGEGRGPERAGGGGKLGSGMHAVVLRENSSKHPAHREEKRIRNTVRVRTELNDSQLGTTFVTFVKSNNRNQKGGI